MIPYYELTKYAQSTFAAAKKGDTHKNSTIFIGLDLGDRFSYIIILDQDGEVIEETRLPTSKSAFQRKFSSLSPCRVAMEVGAQSRWVSHLLRELGHEVIVANARKLRAIYDNPRKGDRAHPRAPGPSGS